MVKRGSSYRCLQECLHGFILATVSTFFLVYLLNKPLFHFSLWPDFKKLLKTTNIQSKSHKISDSRESKKLLLNQLFPTDKYQYMLKPDEDEQPSKFKTELSTKLKLHQVVLPKNLSSGKLSLNSKYFVQNILKQVPIHTHFFYFTTDPSGLSQFEVERLEEYLSKIDEINYFTSFSLAIDSENVDGCNESTGFILSLSVVQALVSLEPDGRTLAEDFKSIGYQNPCAKIIKHSTLKPFDLDKNQPDTRELIREIDEKLESWHKSGNDVLGFGHSGTVIDNENSVGYSCGDYERVFGSREFFTTVKFQTSSPTSKITLIIPILEDAQTKIFMQYFEEGVLSRYRLISEPKMPEINLLFVLEKNYEASSLKAFLKRYKLKYSSLNFQWIQDKNDSNHKFDLKSANNLANSKLKTSHDTLLCSLSPSLYINANFIKTAFLNTRMNSVIYQPGYSSSSTNKITYDPAIFCRYKIDNIDTATQTKLNIWKTADSDLILIPVS